MYVCMLLSKAQDSSLVNMFLFFFKCIYLRFPLLQVGFNPLRVLRKRNKALRKIKKLIKKGELTVTTVSPLLQVWPTMLEP